VEDEPHAASHGTDARGRGTAALDTLRFRRHAARGDARPPGYHRRYDPNGLGKALVDLSRVPGRSLARLPNSVHAPVPECAAIGRDVHAYRTSLLRVHHYLGSREQYFGRQGDTRRNDEKFDRDAALSDGADDDIRPWYQNFVKEAGDVRAKELLAEG